MPPKRLIFRSRNVSDRPFFMLVQMPSGPTNVSFRGATASFMDCHITFRAPPWRVPSGPFLPMRPSASGSTTESLNVSHNFGKMPWPVLTMLPNPSSPSLPAPNSACFIGPRMCSFVSSQSLDTKSLPFCIALPNTPPERLPSPATVPKRDALRGLTAVSWNLSHRPFRKSLPFWIWSPNAPPARRPSSPTVPKRDFWTRSTMRSNFSFRSVKRPGCLPSPPLPSRYSLSCLLLPENQFTTPPKRPSSRAMPPAPSSTFFPKRKLLPLSTASLNQRFVVPRMDVFWLSGSDGSPAMAFLSGSKTLDRT